MKCGAKQHFYNHLTQQNMNLKRDIILVMHQLIGDVINLVNLYFVLPLFDLNFIFLHFKQMLCEQLLGDCVTKPFQLDNGGSYSSEQQSQK